ncbi:MAG: DUF1178 family protein [Alphaproteobacteria bacterium]
MIKFALACSKEHQFESWFPSSSSFDDQAARNLITCPFCGSAKVTKALMAPQVARRDRHSVDHPAAPAADEPAPVAVISSEERELRQKIKELRDHIIAHSDNVGSSFANEARRMHDGEAEVRTIHGTATPDEAKALIDDGIEFHPLPILPDDRN